MMIGFGLGPPFDGLPLSDPTEGEGELGLLSSPVATSVLATFSIAGTAKLGLEVDSRGLKLLSTQLGIKPLLGWLLRLFAGVPFGVEAPEPRCSRSVIFDLTDLREGDGLRSTEAERGKESTGDKGESPCSLVGGRGGTGEMERAIVIGDPGRLFLSKDGESLFNSFVTADV